MDARLLPDVGLGADGAVTHGADALAEQNMVVHLMARGIPIVSEERGVIGGPLQRRRPVPRTGRRP